MTLTNAARNLLAKALTGKTLKFTRGAAGSGYFPEGQDAGEITELVEYVRDMEIASMSIPPNVGTAKITLVLTNKELTQSFFLREIALFAEDPDTGQEVLYGYCNAGDTADFIPAQDSPDPVYYRFNLTIIVDRAKNITAIFAEDPLAVTHNEMNSRIDTILLAMKAEHDILQYQIDQLANASIRNSLNSINYQET